MKAYTRITFLILILGISGCRSTQPNPPKVELALVAAGFTSPVALVVPPDASHRLFVVDQTGLISTLSESQRVVKPFLDLRDRVVELSSFYDERGLLGLAFHPDFAVNGHFYVSYSAPLRADLSPDEWDHTTYISEFTVSNDNPDQADPNSERVLLAIDRQARL
jgi:hypothetical protein